MKKLTFTFLFFLIAYSLYAQKISGDWYGTLNIQGSKLHLVFHITKTGETYASTMDSPDQNAFGLATDQTTFGNNQLNIVASKFGIDYTGTFNADSNKISGTFKQGAATFPLTLTANKPTAEVAPAARPQDPKDFPYKQEDVFFINPKAGDKLAGTLTVPNGKVSKIVILISGSGPQNRDEEIKQFNHRPFLVWSDWLTRQGIAVLRYDDRGIGKSTGDFGTATSADFADDAEAAVNFIKSRNDLRNLSIGLMGHSEGGIIAPMVASRNKNVNFLVLLAGPGVPLTNLMLQQTADQERLGGANPENIKLALATNQKVFATMGQHQDLSTAQLKPIIDSLLYRELRTYPKTALQGKNIDDIVRENEVLLSPWFRYFIAFKPADYLNKIKSPVLALNGTLDMQVNSDANLAAIKTNLQKAGNKNYKIIALPGLNHLFQKSVTGSVAEYAQSTETVNPVALHDVSAWINQL